MTLPDEEGTDQQDEPDDDYDCYYRYFSGLLDAITLARQCSSLLPVKM